MMAGSHTQTQMSALLVEVPVMTMQCAQTLLVVLAAHAYLDSLEMDSFVQVTTSLLKYL